MIGISLSQKTTSPSFSCSFSSQLKTKQWICFTSYNSCVLQSTLVAGIYLLKAISLRPSNPLGPVLVKKQGTAFTGTNTLCVLDRNLRRSKRSKFTTCLHTQIPTVLTKYPNEKRRGIVYKLFKPYDKYVHVVLQHLTALNFVILCFSYKYSNKIDYSAKSHW